MALTMETILSFKGVGDAQLSPDGRLIVFVLSDNHTTVEEQAGELQRFSRSAIWLVPAAADAASPPLESHPAVPRQLTDGGRGDTLPRWSPDGRWLAFLSDRGGLGDGGQRQIWLLPAAAVAAGGGDAGAFALTDVRGAIPTPRGLNALIWAGDSASIFFLLEDEAPAAAVVGDDAIEYETSPAFVRIMQADLPPPGAQEARAARCVSPAAAGQVWEFGVAPGGAGFAAVVSEEPHEWSWYDCRLVTFAAGTDSVVQELPSPMVPAAPGRVPQSRQVAQPQWSPDGSRIAFVTSTWSDRGCVAGTLMLVDSDGSGLVELTPGITASLGWCIWETGGATLLSIGHEDGGTGLHRIAADGSGSARLWWEQP